MKKYYSCAFRRRDDGDGKTSQHFKIRSDNVANVANAVTTVHKDSLIIEEEHMVENYLGNLFGEHIHDGYAGAVFDPSGKSPTVKTVSGGGGQVHFVSSEEYKYRIRKITPKEAWRLMGASDEEYEKAAAVNSGTQLYKEAGNGIVQSVLEAIFCSLGIEGAPSWEEFSQRYL